MHLFHCSVIVLLYFCQGLSQGCLSIIPLLLLQHFPQLPLSSQATLHLPVYAFSLKFLWSPLVDRLYFSLGRIHRRVQWVVPLQLLMVLGYIALVAYGTKNILAASESTTDFNYLFIILSLLSFSSATQDIAVDAWAVEGLPVSECSIAGTLQLVGLLGGIFCCNMYLQLLIAFKEELTLEIFFGFCSICCFAALVLSIALALKSPLSEVSTSSGTPEESLSIGQLVRKLIHYAPIIDTVWILLTRGWPVGLDSLITSRLLSFGILTPATVARYKIYDTIVQIAIGSFVADRLLRHFHPSTLQKFLSCAIMGLVLVNASMYMLFFDRDPANPALPSWYVPYLVFPQLIIGSLLTSVNFVAQVPIFSSSAKQIPAYTGVVMTLLNALANFGMNIPSTTCLYMASIVEHFLVSAQLPLRGFDNETIASNNSSKSRYVGPFDVMLCALTFMVLSLALWKYILVPATHRLEKTIKTDRDNILRACKSS